MSENSAGDRCVSTHDAQHDSRNDDILIYVNGDIVPRAQAVVSVYDSGFLLGDVGRFAFVRRPLGVPG